MSTGKHRKLVIRETNRAVNITDNGLMGCLFIKQNVYTSPKKLSILT